MQRNECGVRLSASDLMRFAGGFATPATVDDHLVYPSMPRFERVLDLFALFVNALQVIVFACERTFVGLAASPLFRTRETRRSAPYQRPR